MLFVTPPWNFLKESDLAQQNVAKRNLYDARKLFQAFDTVLEIPSKLTLVDLNNLYKSKPVQGVLDDFRTTKTGRERRLDQLT
jgi:hypothetical protein